MFEPNNILGISFVTSNPEASKEMLDSVELIIIIKNIIIIIVGIAL
jgi:hypothetical protein